MCGTFLLISYGSKGFPGMCSVGELFLVFYCDSRFIRLVTLFHTLSTSTIVVRRVFFQSRVSIFFHMFPCFFRLEVKEMFVLSLV